MNWKIVVGLVMIAISSACAMPETHIYSLNLTPAMPTRALPPEAALAVVVNSPRYLTQPYIAYRRSPFQLTISRYAKWVAPPEEMVRDAFREALSPELFKETNPMGLAAEGDYTLTIGLKRFERADDGDASFAEVAFNLSLLSPSGQTLFQERFAKRIRLDDRSCTSLAKGLSAAIEQETASVRERIAKVIRP